VAVTIEWSIHPNDQIVPNLDRYDKHIINAIAFLADALAAKMQGEAQRGAPWNDVTTAARSGLTGFAVKAATEVVAYLFHSVEYGPYLELGTSKMAPRPIILPTLQANYPYVMAQVRRILAG